MKANQLGARKSTRRLVRFLGLLAFVYVSICASLYAWQIPLILKPTDEVKKPEQLELGTHFDDIKIPILDSDQNEVGLLNAFWVPANTSDSPVVLHLHGQDATRSKHPEHLNQLRECGFNVLAIEYRGFGESYEIEQPSEVKVYEDALTALNYLKKKFKPHQIFIHGHSLGGAVAIELASRPESAGIAGLIVESTFTSILKMSPLRYGGMLQLLPVSWLLTEKFDSLSKVDSLKLPILFIHGDCDPKVPYRMSQELYEAAASSSQKQKCLINGAGHEDCGSTDVEKFNKHVKEFVSECLKGAEKMPAE